jgi:hypothetical protein
MGQVLAMLQLTKQQQEVPGLHYPHLLPAIEKPAHQDSQEPSSSYINNESKSWGILLTWALGPPSSPFAAIMGCHIIPESFYNMKIQG